MYFVAFGMCQPSGHSPSVLWEVTFSYLRTRKVSNFMRGLVIEN